jgi:hypothetical protein
MKYSLSQHTNVKYIYLVFSYYLKNGKLQLILCTT